MHDPTAPTQDTGDAYAPYPDDPDAPVAVIYGEPRPIGVPSWLASAHLSDGAVRLLLAMYTAGPRWGGPSVMAETIGRSESTVRRLERELRRAGVLEVSGPRSDRHYTLIWDPSTERGAR